MSKEGESPELLLRETVSTATQLSNDPTPQIFKPHYRDPVSARILLGYTPSPSENCPPPPLLLPLLRPPPRTTAADPKLF
jgi:hypothetical protein